MADGGNVKGADFRETVRNFIEENFPPSLRSVNPTAYQTDGAIADADPDFLRWRDRFAETGWGVPTWPKQYGGAELDQDEVDILTHEMKRAGAFNPIRSYGSMMLGPTLLEYGTEAQKAQHIPPIARNALRWCQGFSEPGAGSDLASLQMRCIDMGDHWLVNGQKIWTSGAHHSDWCFALVRTDATKKQGGISFLLIDMKSPGIEARPILLISGATHFCEVFFNDVKVPKENLVGEVNQGWTIAKRLLHFERSSLSESKPKVLSLSPIAHQYLGTDDEGRIADRDLRTRLILNEMRSEAYQLTLTRISAEADAGVGLGAGVSALKNLGSDIQQTRAELAIEILGSDGLGWSGEDYPTEALDATRFWLHSKAFSIYGGSFEVQNNITAKRVLGLPE